MDIKPLSFDENRELIS